MIHRRFLPRREKPKQKCQNKKGHNQPDTGHQKSFGTDQREFETGETEKTLGEKLTADHHIPTHEEDTDQYQNSGYEIEEGPNLLFGFVKLQNS